MLIIPALLAESGVQGIGLVTSTAVKAGNKIREFHMGLDDIYGITTATVKTF